MSESTYPRVSRGLVEGRRALAPEIEDAFRAFSQKAMAEGALSAKVKQLIAVAVAHVTQCPYCITGHTKAASRAAPRPRRSWRRSGSPPRCAPAPRSRTRRWLSPSSASEPRPPAGGEGS